MNEFAVIYVTKLVIPTKRSKILYHIKKTVVRELVQLFDNFQNYKF
jgi:hypothetical protein